MGLAQLLLPGHDLHAASVEASLAARLALRPGGHAVGASEEVPGAVS